MTVTLAICALVSFAVTAASGTIIIPWIKKMHFGQTIKSVGPAWHAKKQGTPYMGGIMFIIGSTVAVTVGLMVLNAQSGLLPISQQQTARIMAGIAATFCFCGVGFTDDYQKRIKKNNDGLGGWYKILLEIFISSLYLFVIHRYGGAVTAVDIPFLGTLELGAFYYAVAIFLMIGFVNAVNLTDGIDGLASSVTLVVMATFVAISVLLNQNGFAVLSMSYAAACAGFLVWNFYPAKVFMGDTGSLFLGGAFVTVIFGLGRPALIFFAGIVYLCEALSVMLQVGYFKLTHGKRIFKMSPIHHHFEMCGWSEIKIVGVFCLVAAVGCAAAVLSIVL